MKYVLLRPRAMRSATQPPPNVPSAPAQSVMMPSVTGALASGMPLSRSRNSATQVANAPSTKVNAV